MTRNQSALFNLLGCTNFNELAIDSIGSGWCFLCNKTYKKNALFKVMSGCSASCPKCGTKTVVPEMRSLTETRKAQLIEVSKFILNNY